MLTAYIDESNSTGQAYVMAGFVASQEQWDAFSAEWSELLRLGPPFRRIDEFKMSAMRDSAIALEQSELFFRVIEKHLALHVTCHIRIADVREAYNKINWPLWADNLDILRNEYYQAFQGTVSGVAKLQEELKLGGPINIVFDEHSDKPKCIRAWDIAKRWGHPWLRSKLGAQPAFLDSKKHPPLQAADVLAYWFREACLNPDKDGFPTIKYPWEVRTKLRGISIFYTPEMILNNFKATVLASALLRQGAPPHLVSAIVSPNPTETVRRQLSRDP